jgi:hypothetical protein
MGLRFAKMPRPFRGRFWIRLTACVSAEVVMAKPHRKIKKANHGSRPSNAKARKRKRAHIKT